MSNVRVGSTRNRHSSNNISLSLVTPHALMSEIDENLAADFDGSFSGLGVDINASSYSMSEALLALPNLSISSSGHIFKQEVLSPTASGIGKESAVPIMYFKEEPNSTNQSPVSMVARKNGSTTKIGGAGKTGISRGSSVNNKRHQKIASAAAQNLEALDLSNDEAHLPETSGNNVSQDGKVQSTSAQKISFIGSVSRESSCEAGVGTSSGNNQHLYNATQILLNLHPSNNAQSVNTTNYNNAVNLSGSHPNLSLAGASVPAVAPSPQEVGNKKCNPQNFGGQIRLTNASGHIVGSGTKTHKVILPLQTSNETVNMPHQELIPIVPSMQGATETITNIKVVSAANRANAKPVTNETIAGNKDTNTYSLLNGPGIGLDEPSETFQYILAAATSNATKLNEPSITYLNQGQAYELRLKKLGDLSPYRGNKNRLLRCKVRICFHERRLQYMELEQLTEWSSKHTNERVLDLDVPLRYN